MARPIKRLHAADDITDELYPSGPDLTAMGDWKPPPCAPSKSERALTAPSSRSFANNLDRRPAKERPAERPPILHACALAFLVRA